MPTPSIHTSEKDNSFYFFCTLWACSVIFQLLSCTCIPYNLIREFKVVGVTELALFIFALTLLLFPSPRILLLVSATYLLNFACWLPHAPNNRVMFSCGSLDLLLVGLYLSKSGTRETFAASLWQKALPIFRIQTIVLYCAAAFHKMNWDFVNPAGSCVTLFYGHIRDVLPILPKGPEVLAILPWAALFIEASLPLLLLFRRTQSVGVLVGLGFHYFLAFDVPKQFLNFSSVMFVFLCSFLPEEFYSKLGSGPWPSRIIRIALACTATAILLASFAYVAKVDMSGFIAFTYSRQLFWWMLSTILIALVIRWAPPWKPSLIPSAERLRVSPAALLVVPICMATNSFLPFIGIKTRSSFDMYSNLQVEAGKSNHFFMPPSLDILGNMRDVVKIIETSDSFLLEEYVKPGLLLTWFEFHRYASEHPDISVTYERNGQKIVLTSAKDNPELVRPINPLIKRALWYRPIDPKSPTRCLW